MTYPLNNDDTEHTGNDSDNENVTGTQKGVESGSLADILSETMLNLEMVEGELARVKRRLLEHLELAGRSDL
jgi:hypothetical protein